MGLIQQLFGMQGQQQAQPPEPQGLVQSILSQRFQPSPMDVADAGAQTYMTGKPVTPADIVSNHMSPVLEAAKTLKTLNGGEQPSSVREYQYWNGLNPQQQQDYLKVKRAEQLLNLGGSFGVRNPVTGDLDNQYQKTLPPQDLPEVKGQQAKETAFGKEQGERTALLRGMEGSLPQLDTTISTLHNLGQKATYTGAGQIRDIAARQLGFGATEGAQAREEYINTVRNVLFPQLRQTFGAQFTAKEGEALISTLGDPNKAPEEKDAALKAFIDQKRQTIGSLRREVGQNSGYDLSTSKGRNNAVLDVFDPGENSPPQSQGTLSPEEIKAAFKQGKISRDEAKKLLQQNHGYQ